MLFQRYVPGFFFNDIIFHFPIGSTQKPILLVSITISLQSNIFNMKKIPVYSVAWDIICIIPENMLQKSLLPIGLNRI